MSNRRRNHALRGVTALVSVVALTAGGLTAAQAQPTDQPWLDTDRPAAERADLLIEKMTLDQKIQQIAISRFNENDTGPTIVIERGGHERIPERHLRTPGHPARL